MPGESRDPFSSISEADKWVPAFAGNAGKPFSDSLRRFDHHGRRGAGLGAKIGRHLADADGHQPGLDVDPCEESTIATLGPMMGVFNNLVMFDQHVPQNSLEAIVP